MIIIKGLLFLDAMWTLSNRFTTCMRLYIVNTYRSLGWAPVKLYKTNRLGRFAYLSFRRHCASSLDDCKLVTCFLLDMSVSSVSIYKHQNIWDASSSNIALSSWIYTQQNNNNKKNEGGRHRSGATQQQILNEWSQTNVWENTKPQHCRLDNDDAMMIVAMMK